MVRYLFAVAACAAIASPASAQTIIGAQSAVINSGGPGSGNIADTYNQNGLATKYVSGVTNFDTYVAGNPLHTIVFAGNEWFSNFGTSTASVTYDLGSVFDIDRLALWNEDTAGIGSLNVFGSTNGFSFSSIGNFTPTNHPSATSSDETYGADVFSFAARSARYLQFNMSGCPQPQSGYNSCSIGEVAFRTAAVVPGAVPEPTTWAMMILGFGVVGCMMRRKAALRFVR